MELESIGLLGDCFKPDATHPFNYMLDTSAINKLAERPEDYKILLLAKERLGYVYFRNLIQDREIIGMKSDGSFYKTSSKMDEKSKIMKQIINDLPIIRIPYMATLMHNAWILDGTCHLLEESGCFYDVFQKVFNNDHDNYEDAVIVESAMRFNCTVVSNDRAMCENTNAVFTKRAIWYKRFIENTKQELERDVERD